MKRVNIKQNGEIKLWVEMEDPTEWLQFHIDNNTWSYLGEYEIEELDITEEVQIKEQIKQYQDYLLSTDWMVIRQMDNGVEIPQEIKNLRQTAREYISNHQ